MDFEMKVDVIDVTTITEENPDWLYKCECGNVISCSNMPREKFVKYEYVIDDLFPVFSWHCKKCWRRVSDEEVAKSIRLSTGRKYAPGLTHYYIDDKEVEKDEWDEQKAAIIAKRGNIAWEIR